MYAHLIPGSFKMQVDDIRNHDAVGLHGPTVPEGGVFLCATSFRMHTIVALEVLRGCPGMRVILPSRDQHMEMRLLLGLVHGARVMKGIGDWQCVPCNGVHEISRQGHVFTVRQLVRQRNFHLQERHTTRPLVLLGGLEVDVRVAISPGGQVPRIGED
jgi:hypothetical protein